ncbi:MAG: aminodeoxychorismate lyase [Rhodospirillaceae bacterium]|nr:aminodeoxychorismate lyase [Rhodospirillaceae bacterium]
MSRRSTVIAIVLFIVVADVLFGGWIWFQNKVSGPGPHQTDQVVLVPPGSGIQSIAQTLVDQGVIESDWVFRLAARIKQADRSLKSGEFTIPAKASIYEVLTVLTKGETVSRSFTVPEGLTVVEALAIVDKAEGLMGPLPPAPDEGHLLPETYHYAYYDTKVQAVRRMEKALDAALEKAWTGRSEGLPLNSPEEALVLASIVEKETGVAAERPRVAGVFINRLKRGMKLQSDPTVIYGITRGEQPLDRELTRADLDGATAYNTYVISGLPPTPIANVGQAAIEAVMHPEETDALYFVADGTGGHAFSKTLNEHNRNVAKWRKFKRQNR